jgi:hypothetical protein
MMKAVRAEVVENKNWKQKRHKFLRQYRATPHHSACFSPFQLTFEHVLHKTITRSRQIDPYQRLKLKSKCNQQETATGKRKE